MKSPGELRLDAARCRRLANGMGNPDDARNLSTLASEYEAAAYAGDEAGAADPSQKHHKG